MIKLILTSLLSSQFKSLFIFTHLLLWSVVGHAQSQKLDGITINSQSMERNSVSKISKLSGRVQIVFHGQYLSCDEAIVNENTKTVVAQGNVVLQNQKVYAEGDKVEFNYETNIGTIYSGFVQSGQVLFEGEIIKKEGPDEYVAINGKYTACKNCPPSWSFTGSEIKAQIGGYANIKYPVLRIADIPVLILPRIIVPLKSSRQSGLLVPKMDFGDRSEFAISESYFWAISRSQDLTITGKHHKRLGFQGLAEYRYSLNPTSGGNLKAGFIDDLEFKEEFNRDSGQRGFLSYKHYYELPHGFTQRANVNYVSDLRYPKDYIDDIAGYKEPALENRASLTKNTDNHHLSVEVDYYINLLKLNPLQLNNDSVHRFPEIQYSLMEQRVFDTDLLFRMNMNYVNFVRETFSYDDVTGTGNSREATLSRDSLFDPTKDLIRTGHRFDFQPTLSLPVSVWNLFDIVPSITYRETQYRFNARTDQSSTPPYSNTAARRSIQTDLSAKTIFSRIYEASNESNSTLYKHEIEPQISFSSIPWIRRPEHPFFGKFEDQPYSRVYEPISDNDFLTPDINGIQFDYKDRVFDKELVDFKISSRVIRKMWVGERSSYENIFDIEFSQAYDFNESRRTEESLASTNQVTRQPWSPINAKLSAHLNNVETYMTATYYPYARVTNTYARVRLLNQGGDFFELAHTDSVIVASDNSLGNRKQELRGGIGLVSKYINLSARVDYDVVTSGVTSWSAYTLITPPGNCWGISLDINQEVGKKLKYTINYVFNFGGDANIVEI